jgi:hypothetical protein
MRLLPRNVCQSLWGRAHPGKWERMVPSGARCLDSPFLYKLVCGGGEVAPFTLEPNAATPPRCTLPLLAAPWPAHQAWPLPLARPSCPVTTAVRPVRSCLSDPRCALHTFFLDISRACASMADRGARGSSSSIMCGRSKHQVAMAVAWKESTMTAKQLEVLTEDGLIPAEALMDW